MEHKGHTISTLDLAGKGRSALLTGTGGEAWREAATEVSERTGMKIASFQIGPGREVLDLYGDWARLFGVEASGCVLVTPDTHVTWRRRITADDRAAELGRVVDRILCASSNPRTTRPPVSRKRRGLNRGRRISLVVAGKERGGS